MKLSIMFVMLFILGVFAMAYFHEESHVAIFKAWGVDSEIKMFSLKYFPDAVTVPDQHQYYERCNDNCKLAHGVAEAVTYPMVAVYLMIGLGIFMMLRILEDIEDAN